MPEWTTVHVGYSYTGIKNWTLSANIPQLHNGMGRYFGLSASYKF